MGDRVEKHTIKLRERGDEDASSENNVEEASPEPMDTSTVVAEIPAPVVEPAAVEEPVVQLSAEEMRRQRLARLDNTGLGPLSTPSHNVVSGANASPPVTPPVSKPMSIPTQRKGGPSPTTMDYESTSNKFGTTPPKLGTTPPASGVIIVTEAQFAKWENDIIESAFECTLDENRARGRIVYLADIAEELALEMSDANTAYPLNSNTVDRVLVSRLSNDMPGDLTPVKYLLGVFTRLYSERESTTTQQSKLKVDSINNMCNLVVSYAGLAIKNADYFRQSVENVQLGSRILIPHLMAAGPEESTYVPPAFFDSLVTRYQDDGLDQMFFPILMKLSVDMRNQKLGGEYMPYLRALAVLASRRQTSLLMTKVPNWLLQGRTGRDLENTSFLGPFFKLSPVDDPEIGRTFFTRANIRTSSDLDVSFNSLRRSMRQQQDVLILCVKNLLKADKENIGIENFLSWVAAVSESNISRTKMHPDYQRSSSDGFLLNLGTVMLELCKPIVEKPAMMQKIDSAYLLITPRVDVKSDTKLFATTSETDRWIDVRNLDLQQQFRDKMARLQKDAGVSNTDYEMNLGPKSFGFTTEVFFLTARVLHVGLLPSITKFYKLLRNINDADRAYADLEQTKRSLAGQPQAAHVNAQLERLKAELDAMRELSRCFEVVLMDHGFLGSLLKYYVCMASWLVKIIDPEGRGPPLTVPCPPDFANLPEHLVENIADFLLYLAQFDILQPVFNAVSMEPFMIFVVDLISSPLHVKNPYLRAKLVQLLSTMVPQGNRRVPPNASKMYDNPIARACLGPLLMNFYVDIEHTGSHTQFYDKFSVRHNISVIMEHLWSIPEHRQAIEIESSVPERFLKFVNMLLNDAIFTLDESLAKLTAIRGLQILMASGDWNSLSEQERRDKEQELHSAEQQVSSWMNLANESIHMLLYLSSSIVEPFMRPELIDRMAEMLNYLVVQLVGPTCTNLKVSDPDKYHFRPKELLKEIAQIYLHLSEQDRFAAAVAHDERSYKAELFQKLINTLKRLELLPAMSLRKLEKFTERVAQEVKNNTSLEEILGEVPEEFMDPILNQIMTDPVILPSKNRVDRAFISRHLLSDPSDPFTRQALTIDQVVPDTELKARIDAFIADKRREAAAKQAAANQ